MVRVYTVSKALAANLPLAARAWEHIRPIPVPPPVTTYDDTLAFYPMAIELKSTYSDEAINTEEFCSVERFGVGHFGMMR